MVCIHRSRFGSSTARQITPCTGCPARYRVVRSHLNPIRIDRVYLDANFESSLSQSATDLVAHKERVASTSFVIPFRRAWEWAALFGFATDTSGHEMSFG